MKLSILSMILVIISMVSILNLMYPTKVLADNNLTEWNVLHVTGKFLYSNPPKPDQIFNFQYRVLNGTLGNLTIKQQIPYTAKVNSNDTGMFELKIPRNYPYSNIDNVAKFGTYVDVNGIEINSQKYSPVTTDCFYVYSIPFSGTAIISLQFREYPEPVPYNGDTVPDYCITETIKAPEFPFAIPILVIAITSLVLFYRLKLFRTSRNAFQFHQGAP